VNDLLTLFGLERWKPVLGTLVLPPVPLIALAFVGAVLLHRQRRAAGWTLVAIALAATWAACTAVVGSALIDTLTRPPPGLSAAKIAQLSHAPKTAIVVLGAGRRLLAPEYGAADLTPLSIERLRYGAWLARQTGLPVAFSGGIGHGGEPGPSEAETARRVAARDFGLRLRWTEERSRDTQENALYTVPLLREQGIERIVLVTHGFHMRRATAAFERAIRRAGSPIELVEAPLGLRAPGSSELAAWLPSADGFARTQLALHEWLGRLAGA
jgi:uncharacterized SAM-binding protein YcdF (DUF218 family)